MLNYPADIVTSNPPKIRLVTKIKENICFPTAKKCYLLKVLGELFIENKNGITHFQPNEKWQLQADFTSFLGNHKGPVDDFFNQVI